MKWPQSTSGLRLRYRNLRQEKERLIEVQEEAQKKLARDLHDGPTQGVAALAMRANFVRRLLERDGNAAGEELFKMEDLARLKTSLPGSSPTWLKTKYMDDPLGLPSFPTAPCLLPTTLVM